MTEEAESVINQEIAEPEAYSENQEQVNQENQDKNIDSKEYNFAKLRERSEKAEQRSNELERMVKELKESFEKKNAPVPPPEVDDLDKLDPEDIITVSQAMKVSERQAKKIVQEMLDMKEKAALPEKTRSKFDDYDSIMTTENINKLEQQEPEIAEICSKAKNPWSTTYKMIKKFIEPNNINLSVKGEKKMQENMSKPSSINTAINKTPLQNAYAWSEADKDALRKEMLGFAKKAL